MPASQLQTAQNILAHGSITTQNLVSAGIATPGSAVELNCEGVSVARIQIGGTYTGVLTLQGTVNGVVWSDINALTTFVDLTGFPLNVIPDGNNGIYIIQTAGYLAVRITGLAAITGSADITIIGSQAYTSQMVQGVQGIVAEANPFVVGRPVPVAGTVRTTAAAPETAGVAIYMPITSGRQVIEKPYGPGETDWQFAVATGGITNTTTAVTIKAAAGASIRNYCTGLTLMAQALGAATEVAIRDGAGGTVLWRSYIAAAGLPATSIVFPTPLRGTANTLMEFVTLTASVTGAVFISAQGYAGA